MKLKLPNDGDLDLFAMSGTKIRGLDFHDSNVNSIKKIHFGRVETLGYLDLRCKSPSQIEFEFVEDRTKSKNLKFLKLYQGQIKRKDMDQFYYKMGGMFNIKRLSCTVTMENGKEISCQEYWHPGRRASYVGSSR